MVPTIGTPCTIHIGSDSNPATIILVSSSGKTAVIQHDSCRIISGSEHDGSASYEYAPNPDGATETIRLCKRGWQLKYGRPISLGYRRYYRDPSF